MHTIFETQARAQQLQQQVQSLQEELSSTYWELEKQVAASTPATNPSSQYWHDCIKNPDPTILDSALRKLASTTGGKMKIFLHGPYLPDRSDTPKLSIGELSKTSDVAAVYTSILAMIPAIQDPQGKIQAAIEIPDNNDMISYELHIAPQERAYQVVEFCKGRQQIIHSDSSLWNLLHEVHKMVVQRNAVVSYTPAYD